MASEYQYFVFKPEIYQEPKKLAELQPGARNFCGDFNARNCQKMFEFLASHSLPYISSLICEKNVLNNTSDIDKTIGNIELIYRMMCKLW